MALYRRPVIFGEVLYDRFPDGAAVLGGAPFNVAWNLHAFGMRPLFISRVGDDPLGHAIRSAMRSAGMDTAGLQLDSAHPTGTVEVSLEQGQPAYDIVAQRAYDHIEADKFPPLGDDYLLYHGSLALRNPVSREALNELRRNAGGGVFVDVNLRSPWWERDDVREQLLHARWVKLNHEELAQLQGGDSGDDARALLQNMGLRLLILTRGEAGAEIVTADGEHTSVAPQAACKVVDTVGAGDALASVILLGLLKGWPLTKTLQRAQEFASRVVGMRGATSDDPEFYREATAEWGS